MPPSSEKKQCPSSGTASIRLRPISSHCFLLPPGVVHAAGGGVKIIEITEASDLRFRLHDWDNGREDCHQQ